MSIYIKNSRIIKENKIKKMNILIEDSYIKKIDKPENFSFKEKNNSKIIDAKGCYVLPGIIDSHTHYLLKSRNSVTADDFYSGSLASAFGGVTTFIDFIDDQYERGFSFKESLKNRKEEARDSVVDYSFHQVVTHYNQNIVSDLREIKDEGINNVKLFTTYRREGYLIEEAKLYELFKVLKQLRLLPIVHAEDNQIIEEKEREHKKEDKIEIKYHPDIRPAEAEAKAVENIAELIDLLKMPGYIVHLSSKLGLKELKKQVNKGININAETAPHYLILNKKFLEGKKGRRYFMTPPLRTKEDNRFLWEGLTDGFIDVIATDHCAFSESQKNIGDSVFNVLPGIPGSETLLPLIHNYGRAEGLSLVDIVKKLSTNPAKIFGLYPQKGSLQCGTDADLVIFDPEKNKKLNEMYMHSNAGYSPYDHIEVKGYPITTINRGNIIIEDGFYRGNRGGGEFIKAGQSSLF
ncbi:MAG: amidohydrolase family protein [Halanaerobiales bacterium]|nr:amidohydrolase family protein [Halanaerobiales bacterium]